MFTEGICKTLIYMYDTSCFIRSDRLGKEISSSRLMAQICSFGVKPDCFSFNIRAISAPLTENYINHEHKYLSLFSWLGWRWHCAYCISHAAQVSLCYHTWCSSLRIVDFVFIARTEAKLFDFIKALSQADLDLSVPLVLPSTGEATVRSYTHRPAFSHPTQRPTMSFSLSLYRKCECWGVAYGHEVHHRPRSTNTAVDRTVQRCLLVHIFISACIYGTFFCIWTNMLRLCNI